MDENINEIYKTTINDLFPDLDVNNKQEVIDIFGGVLDNVFDDFYNSTYFSYFESKPRNTTTIQHLSKVPDGVDNFEQWLKACLEKMSIQLTSELQNMLPPGISLIYFAQLLDSQNFDEFFKKVKFTKKFKIPFKNGLIEIFNERGLKQFILAMSCSCIGLSNSANSLNYLWIQSCLFEDEDIYKLINEAKKLEAVSNQAALTGKKGADNRWEPRNKTREYAFQLADDGNYKNRLCSPKLLLYCI